MKAVWGILALAVASHASAATVITYAPKSVVDIRGHVEVADFGYIPDKPSRKPNQIPNTAIGNIMLTQTVGAFIADAVRQELRVSGVSLLPGAPCKLGGEVVAVRVDDLGFDADFTLTARYRLTRANGEAIYEIEQPTSFSAFKANGPASISLLFANNINAVIGSDKFISSFEANCQGNKTP